MSGLFHLPIPYMYDIFADMGVMFKIKVQKHIYIYNIHSMIGVPTHEATNNENVKYIYIYVTCKR